MNDTQTEIKKELANLMKLDYDAVEICKEAVNKLKKQQYKEIIQAFKENHQQHLTELLHLLKMHNKVIPKNLNDWKWLVKGKIALSSLGGDKAILRTIWNNALKIRDSYEKVKLNEHLWFDAENLITNGLKDIERHKDSLENLIS
jgi:hypothetical protein